MNKYQCTESFAMDQRTYDSGDTISEEEYNNLSEDYQDNFVALDNDQDDDDGGLGEALMVGIATEGFKLLEEHGGNTSPEPSLGEFGGGSFGGGGASEKW